MKSVAIAATLGAVLIAGSAFAQLASPDPKTVQAGAYAVEPYHTRVQFSVTHFGFTRATRIDQRQRQPDARSEECRGRPGFGVDPGRLGVDHQRQAG